MFLLNYLLCLLLIAGHCELCTTLVNRVHSLPILHGPLKQMRHLLDLWLIGFPLLFVLFAGFTGPALLLGGSWLSLAGIWKFYLTACTLGTVGLLYSTVRWQCDRPARKQVYQQSQTIDISNLLSEKPITRGPYYALTRVPGNEIFQLQVNEKLFRAPCLNAALDNISILHLSDLHFTGTITLPFFEQVMQQVTSQQADIILFTGDLLDDMQLLDWIPKTLGTLHAPLGCYFILGNHDWNLQPDLIRQQLTACGWTDLAGKTENISYNGASLCLGGTERPWMGDMPDFCAATADAFRLLLSHSPDQFAWAQANNIDLMLSGHNHGGQVVLPVIGPVFAPSRYGVQYAAGSYWSEPTLLHVSRGVSGQHPLRWNCPPEITKLILRSEQQEAAQQYQRVLLSRSET